MVVVEVDDEFVVVKVGQMHLVLVVVDVVVVVVVVLVVATNTTAKGCLSLCATTSTHVPSRLARWILSVHVSAQYSFLEFLSNASPVGDTIP